MRFGWDSPKSDRNSRERGLPLAVATALFDGPTIEFDDTRHNYGEQQIIALGAVADRVLLCIYTVRGTGDDPVRWIISLRKANQDENHAYCTAFPR
jgi:hypothetical protein